MLKSDHQSEMRPCPEKHKRAGGAIVIFLQDARLSLHVLNLLRETSARVPRGHLSFARKSPERAVRVDFGTNSVASSQSELT